VAGHRLASPGIAPVALEDKTGCRQRCLTVDYAGCLRMSRDMAGTTNAYTDLPRAGAEPQDQTAQAVETGEA
jgi:hypothetical protein